MSWLRKRGALYLPHLLALLPLAWLLRDLLFGDLSADPIRDIQLRTGRYALALLVISLASTPLRSLFGGNWWGRLRRLTGLYAFGYATLHLFNFLGVDYQFNLTFLRADILEKRYALVGLAAYLCLLPVAVTSTRGWRERLGPRWRRLHYLVYAASLLAVTHFVWQAKLDLRLPLASVVLVAVLLLVRLPVSRRVLRRLRGGAQKKSDSRA
ncbi:MAG: protein-methionine-sulfoxide reductase heme-binding subunit MsrQ [Chloroflexota bacterium]